MEQSRGYVGKLFPTEGRDVEIMTPLKLPRNRDRHRNDARPTADDLAKGMRRNRIRVFLIADRRRGMQTLLRRRLPDAWLSVGRSGHREKLRHLGVEQGPRAPLDHLQRLLRSDGAAVGAGGDG